MGALNVVLNITARELAKQALPQNNPGRAAFQRSLLDMSGGEVDVSLLNGRSLFRYFSQALFRKRWGRAEGGRIPEAPALHRLWRFPVRGEDLPRRAILHTDLHFVRWIGDARRPVVWSTPGLFPDWHRYKDPDGADAVIRELIRYFEQAAEDADVIVATTESGLRNLRELTNIPRDKMTLARMPFLMPLLAKAEGSKGLRAVFIGRDASRKGLDDVLLAVERVRAKGIDVRLDVVSASRPAASAAATFHGMLPRSDILRLLGRADIYIVPSKAETYYIPLLEALASGTAVITSAIQPLSEVIVDGETGFLVAPGNVDALTNRLEALADDEILRRRFSEAGKEVISSQFGRSAQRQWVEIYRDVAS